MFKMMWDGDKCGNATHVKHNMCALSLIHKKIQSSDWLQQHCAL